MKMIKVEQNDKNINVAIMLSINVSFQVLLAKEPMLSLTHCYPCPKVRLDHQWRRQSRSVERLAAKECQVQARFWLDQHAPVFPLDIAYSSLKNNSE